MPGEYEPIRASRRICAPADVIFYCSRVPEDQRVDIDEGRIWVESMNRTLSRLDKLCANQPGEERTSR